MENNDGASTKELMLMQFPVDDDDTVPNAPPPELIKPDKLYVAVGKDVKRSESVLMWAIQNSGGKKICIIHVHQPPQMVNILGRKHHVSSLPEEEVKASLEIERQIMHKTLDSYTTIAVNYGVERAQSLHIERDSIEEGILELIFKKRIDKLVMGAAADENYHMNMVEPTSKKAIYVQSHAPAFCSVWFICKGALIYTSRDDVIQAKTHRGLEIPTTLNARAERGLIDSHFTNLAQGYSYTRGFGGKSSSTGKDASLISISSNEAAGYMELPTSSYSRERQLQQEPYVERENARSQWREEQKYGQARLRKDNLRLGSLLLDSARSQISEEDDLFLLYSQESERRKEAERSHALMKLKFTKFDDEKLSLLYQIQDYEQKLKDLEDNFASVVAKHESEKEELFKLSEERANAPAFFCVLSSDDIKEATNEFDASMQVWQGDDWTAFKGFIAHTEVIVKIFPDALHGPIKYNREVEVLSKFRHPNLLTLIGACPDMNALVFEFICNGCLNFHLSRPDGTPSLSWKIRIKIATELCSLLLFLHSRQPQGVVHGALTPRCILLDSTFRCKVYDFWRSHLYATGDDSGQVTSPYIDPEIAVRGEITPASDVYSFGVILLELLTGKSDIQIRQAVTDALALQDLTALLDSSAGEWPLVQALQFAYLGLRCCDESSENRPDLDLEVWRVLKPMWDSCRGSFNSIGGEAPSCFICPIYQEVMIDPHVAADGYTYEAEALKDWLELGKMTSPMTNLPLDHQNLIPNHTLRSAIQEWKDHH